MRTAFFGTPQEAVPSLDALREVSEVAFVVTRPDRPRGRSGRSVAPPVKSAALAAGLEVLQPAHPADVAGDLEGCSVAVVVAYGRILPASLLSVPDHGFVNVHFSLLPRWRGASPVVRAILAGDELTGVTLMRVDEGLDTGPILASASTAIGGEESAGELTARLAAMGADLIRTHLWAIAGGEATGVPQDPDGVTHAGRIHSDEAFIDPRRHGTVATGRAVRAFNPRPGAWGLTEEGRIKLWRARPASVEGPPSGVAEMRGGRVLLGCRDGSVELLEVQPQGRPAMAAAAWMNGRRGAPAEFLPASGRPGR